jgi:hypothetical protein
MKAENQPEYINLTNLIGQAEAELLPLEAKSIALNTNLTREKNNLSGWVSANASALRTERINSYNAAINQWIIQIADVESKILSLENDVIRYTAMLKAFLQNFNMALANGFTEEEAAAEASRLAAEIELELLAKEEAEKDEDEEEFVWEWYHYAGISVGVLLIGLIIWKAVKK